MFTGIVEAVGQIEQVESRQGDVRLHIATGALDLADVALGDSIAVSGVCLTCVAVTEHGFAADVSRESLHLTTLSAARKGTPVNLEKALRVGDRLGGHMVSGHVDGIGSVVAIHPDARSQRWEFQAPSELMRYIAAKGSITIAGTSLTVNTVDGNRFGVNLVPHTVEHTLFRHLAAGAAVNLEVDMIARYLERLLQADRATDMDRDFLHKHGFA